MTRPLALSHGNPSSPTPRPDPRHPAIRRRILYAHHTTAPCIVADLIDSQGLQVSKSLDAASRRPRRSQVSELGRHLRGPRKRRMRGVSKRGCNTCAVTGSQTNNVGVVVRYYMLEWCGDDMVSALWFGSQAKRDTAAMVCGVILAAVVPRQSRESRQLAPKHLHTPNVIAKVACGMRLRW